MLKKKFRILLVEDRKEQRKILCDFLISEGYDATGAENGETAIKAFLKGRFDLVILDSLLSGIELFNII